MPVTMSSNNNLIDVVTYSDRATPYLANSNPWIGVANRKYDAISGIPGQLGATALIKTPIQANVIESLVWNTQGWNQQFKTISVDSQYSSSMEVSTTQFIFNVEDFLQDTARPMISRIGDKIGERASQLAIHETYRFFGSTTQPFSSQNDLGRALAAFRNYGCAYEDTVGILYDTTISDIIAGQSNVFTPVLNDKYTNSWALANFGRCDWMSTNIMSIHIAGTEGQADSTLTVVSVTRNTLGQITAITFSGTDNTTDPNSIKSGDKLYAIPTTGYQLPYYNTYNSELQSANVLQLSAQTDAGATGGQVTVTLNFPLQAFSGAYPANISTDVVPGMQFKVLNSFKAGLLMSGKALYVAVPPLPDQDPYQTKVSTDPESGVSLMFSAGWQLGQANFKFGYSAVAGYTLIPQQSICLVQPL